LDEHDRIIGADSQVGDGRDRALRPLSFDDFVGQKSAIKNLKVYVEAARRPVISKAGDLAALLTNLEPRDVLFIDEIHRLNPVVEEVLYPAMEDFELDLIIGEGPRLCATVSVFLCASNFMIPKS